MSTMTAVHATGTDLIFDDSQLQLHNVSSFVLDPGGTSPSWIKPEGHSVNNDGSTSGASHESSMYYNLMNGTTRQYEPWNFTSNLGNSEFSATNGTADTASVQYMDIETGFSDIMGIWVTAVFCILGIAGNILSFMVLVRAFGKSPMFFVLRAVAVSDAIFLFCVFVIQTLVNMYPFTGIFQLCYIYRGYIQFSVWPILMMTQMSTVWLTILVSIERYIAICFPLKSAYLLSLKRIKRAVTLVFVISILYNVPRYFEYEVVTSAGMSNLQKSSIGDNRLYRYLYMSIMYSILLFLLPLALLIILNAKLVLALQQGKRQWQKLHSRQRKEQTLTIIPLTIVLVFFICGTPAVVVNIIDSLDPNIDDINFIRFLVVANLLVVLNSACNFIIYCMLGKRFRTKLLELCRCHQRTKNSYRVVHQIVASRISDV